MKQVLCLFVFCYLQHNTHVCMHVNKTTKLFLLSQKMQEARINKQVPASWAPGRGFLHLALISGQNKSTILQ